MTQTLTSRFTPRLVVGMTLLWIGSFWLIGELGFPHGDEIAAYWPIGVIAMAAAVALNGGGLIASAVIALVGLALLNASLDLVDLDIGNLWPLVLVIIGISLIGKGMRSRESAASESSDRLRSTSILSNRSHRVESSFVRGDITAILGGSEVDLRRASFEGEAVIEMFALAGGVTIRVAPDTRVVSSVTPIMASYEDKRSSVAAPARTLVLRGLVVWCSVEVLSDERERGESW